MTIITACEIAAATKIRLSPNADFGTSVNQMTPPTIVSAAVNRRLTRSAAGVVGRTALTASTTPTPNTIARPAARTRFRYAAWAASASVRAASRSSTSSAG